MGLLQNLPSSLRVQRSPEVHLSTATSRSKSCLFRHCLPYKYCICCKVLDGLEDMPAKRTVALEVVLIILLVATLFCNIQMTWEVLGPCHHQCR